MQKYHIFDPFTGRFLPTTFKKGMRMARTLAYGSGEINLDGAPSKTNNKGGPIGGGDLE